MRSLLVATTLVLAAVAGCVTNSADDGPSGSPTATPSGYALDCSIASPAPWPEPCLAFASPNESPSKTEIDLAVNPTDPLNVVVASKDLDPEASKCVWAVAQVSKDGGATWTTSYLGGKTSERVPTDPLYGWNCITDPIMAFASDGTLYYSLQAYDHTIEGSDVPAPPLPLPAGVTAGSAILATKSTDGGLTWEPAVPLLVGDGPVIFHDYMRVAVNPATGTYYTIWNQFTGLVVVPVLVAWNGGASPEPPVYIPVPDAPGNVIMSGLAVATDGTVYVALNDGVDAWLTTSTDDAKTFSAPVQYASHDPVPRMMDNNTFRTGSGFELAIDNSGGERDGWLYSTFASLVDGRPDVFALASSDGGATWSEPYLVKGGHGDQWMDRPFVDDAGALHVVMLDRGYDPQNFGIGATWAVSTDGAETFQTTRLTEVLFDGGLGIHQDGFPFIGDYLGIWGSGASVFMGFPTTATGRAEIAVAKVARDGA